MSFNIEAIRRDLSMDVETLMKEVLVFLVALCIRKPAREAYDGHH